MIKRIFPFCLAFLFFACKKQNADYNPPMADDYYPLQIGSYIDYTLDSTLFVNFGQDRVEVHYQAREVVEDSLVDNIGRPSYRVVRYIRKTESEPWTASITYMVTRAGQNIEVIENNLRFIKLASPVVNNFSWKGNKYIDTYSTELDLNYLEDWDYTYDEAGQPLTIGALNFDNTVKVLERDEFLGQDPSIPGTQYAEKSYATEAYAKGIGLIYREFLHWEWQVQGSYYDGYGIKLTITGHGKY